MLVIKTRRIRKIYHGYLSAKELLNFCGKLFRRFIRVSRDFPQRSLISATLTSLRVEEEERRDV
ncbi:hypothetical protein ES703_57983 [subsurface metagenome]